MVGRKIKGVEGSSRGMYIRNNADIPPRWKDVRSIADIPKLYEIVSKRLKTSENNLGVMTRKINISQMSCREV
ncbi:MAG: hypothetical protein QMD22_08980 [archaeon]|nr:hypothetical protein [archaeon]